MLGAALLCLAAVRADAAQWKRLDSAHLVTYSQLSEVKSREFVMRLEMLHWLAMKLMGVSDASGANARAPMELYLFGPMNSDISNVRMSGLHLAGEEGECFKIVGLKRTHVVNARVEAQIELQVALETHAQILMWRYAPMSYPQAWYAKGFARYLAATEFVDGELYLGDVHRYASYWLSSGIWMPYEDVLRWSRDAPAKPTFDKDAFEAQSWLLVHHLMSTPQGKQHLADYLERQAKGEESVAAFEAATGRGMVDWNRALKDYAAGSLKLFKIRSGSLPNITLQNTQLAPDAAKYLDLQPDLRCGSAAAEKATALQAKLHARVFAPDEASPDLKLALARADIRAGAAKDAIEPLQAMVATSPELAEARYLLGSAWLQRAKALAGDEQRSAHEQAREHLWQATRLQPADAAAHFFLAQAQEALGQTGPAQASARAARTLAPTIWAYALLEARLDLQVADRQAAVQALETFAFQAASPDVARRSLAAISAIQAGKSADEIMKPLTAPETHAKH